MKKLRKSGQALSLLNDDRCLQEGIQLWGVEPDELPSDFALLQGAILGIVNVSIKLLHKCHINMLLWQSGESSMPLPPFQLLKKFIVLSISELHVLLWKNVSKMNVVLIVALSDLRDKFGGVPCGFLPLWPTGTSSALLRGHQKKKTKVRLVRQG